jgi:mycofactocin precursor
MENEKKEKESARKEEKQVELPSILEEINIEELAVDGICGIY